MVVISLRSPVKSVCQNHFTEWRKPMPITKLYVTWMNKITQFLPTERMTRIRNLAWLVSGIFESKSVHLSKVARHSPASQCHPAVGPIFGEPGISGAGLVWTHCEEPFGSKSWSNLSFDRGWQQSWLWSSVFGGSPGLSSSGYTAGMDVGAQQSRT